MKVPFDDLLWQRLQDDLEVARVCGDSAGKVYPFAKSALQQAAAAITGERDATPEERDHALEMVRRLRNHAADAANAFAAAVAILDDLTAQLGATPHRPRRRA
jgi:hypothetical protein